ncbi:hypothetical protein [Serinibacter salmoneus]|uniref:Lipoprotein n=1 Tax=Serinibacter salmoneus TaxID=556530 RepID=A0A2A9D0H8_9MICO|nr:hypothetical protein [Serinibacter salmoneus]PFG20153.1 hypothetical protein ATL40_1740 [Serinibacter salmoneus]
MRHPNPIALSSMALVVLTACAPASPDPAANSTPSSSVASTPDASVSLGAEEAQWLEELRENRSEVGAQQERERAEAEALLPLPAGAEWSTFERFAELDEQIERLEGGSGLSSGQTHPMPLRYEDGFFASLMAIDWQCAWLSEAVSQYDAGNLTAAQDAVETLRSFTEKPLAAAFPDYSSYLEAFVEPLGPEDTDAATPTLLPCAPESLVPAYRETVE